MEFVEAHEAKSETDKRHGFQEEGCRVQELSLPGKDTPSENKNSAYDELVPELRGAGSFTGLV